VAELSELPHRQRELAKRCRQVAAAMRRDAEHAAPETRAPYLLLAQHWEELAAEAETVDRKPIQYLPRR
jgi:hypothetical protein